MPPSEKDNPQLMNNFIVINIERQTLSLYSYQTKATVTREISQLSEADLIRSFSVSTAKNGIGSQEGTGCTPLGRHVIAEKIGGGAALGSVFVGRVATGEVYSQSLAADNPKRDWILSRILWLRGCEPSINQGSNELGCCDTYQRYIYIHGTPDTEPMGVPFSHGCIRMRNDELVWLFERVDENTPVQIVAS